MPLTRVLWLLIVFNRDQIFSHMLLLPDLLRTHSLLTTLTPNRRNRPVLKPLDILRLPTLPLPLQTVIMIINVRHD